MRRKEVMAKLKEIIKERYLAMGKSEEDLKNISSKDLAFQIAFHAHRNQKRVNGDNYITHPLSMAESYLNIFYKDSESPYTAEAMKDNGIPHFGVMEVILMHDVIEDTEYTLKDIEETYDEFGLKWFFREYIKRPLKLITHIKSESHKEYMEKLLDDPIASLAKLFDTMDNLNLMTLTTFGDKEYDRAKRYLKNFKMINDRYHYLEKINAYLDDIGTKEKRA